MSPFAGLLRRRVGRGPAAAAGPDSDVTPMRRLGPRVGSPLAHRMPETERGA